MNAQCNGHRFKIHGSHYYRCLFDGTVIAVPESLTDGSLCPVCQRVVDGEDACVVSYRETIRAKIDTGGGMGVIKVKASRCPTPTQVVTES